MRGHNTNLAVAGTGVDELAGQADQALAAKPLPELFLIQSVDNDMRCDGTDADNYAPFAATLTDVLNKITSAAPTAKILIVSSPWATVQNYGQVAAQLPGPRAANSGTGPCDLFDPSGKPVPAHWRTLEGITLHYLGELKSVCAPRQPPALSPGSSNSVIWRLAGAERRELRDCHGVRVGDARRSAPASTRSLVTALVSATSKATRRRGLMRRPTSTASIIATWAGLESSRVARPMSRMVTFSPASPSTVNSSGAPRTSR